MEDKDYTWIWGILYFILVIAFFIWAFKNPPSFNDWFDSTQGILPSYP